MKKLLGPMKWMLVVSGVLITVLGITMLFMPQSNLTVLAMLIGGGVLVSGIAEIVSFCAAEKGRRVGYLIGGILSALFGLWVLVGSGTEALTAVIPFAFAAWVLTSGVLRIVNAATLGSEGAPMWGLRLALGIMGTLFGFLLLFSPVLSAGIVSVLIATIFIFHGIDNIAAFFRVKAVGELIETMLESDDDENLKRRNAT